MSRNKLMLLLGILLAIMPVLGFPVGFKNFFYVVVGIILIIIAVLGHVRRRSAEVSRGEVVTETHGNQEAQ